jgi:DNA-binding transcriptional ArsR family regulator
MRWLLWLQFEAGERPILQSRASVRSTPWRVVLFYNRRLYDKRRVWRNVPIRTSIIDKQEHIEQAARALKSISHPLRLKILCVIGDQDACVQEIVDAVGTSQSNISQHLAILREKGVLLARKDANRVYYRVGDARTLQLIGMMREVFCGD